MNDLKAMGPILLTALLALTTTVLLLILATPLAWWLARTRSPIRPLIEALTAMPLVLPPTVLGFYLLLLFSPTAPLGEAWLSLTGSSLSFSFSGLVLASMLYSLPFMVQPLQASFAQIDPDRLDAAASLRAGPWDRFFSIIIPGSARGFLAASVLTFAHTVGEFGVVLMVGGNIPGRTQVISIALYDYVETIRYEEAHALAAGLMLFSFLVLSLVYTLRGRPALWGAR